MITTTSHNNFNWTACQNNMCRVYINNKDEAEWYSQKQQKKHRLYDTIRVFTKEIVILDQIDIEEVNTHGIQKENFPEYNKEVYVFKNNEEDIKQDEAWKKAVKQIKIITKEVINIVWKSQKSEWSTVLYNSKWTSAENDI